MAWVNFDTKQKSWLVQWKAPFEGKKRYQLCLRVRCDALGGDKEQAEHVARRLKEEIDVAEDKSTKPVFQEAMDCIIAEVLSTMPQDEFCHCICFVFAIVIVVIANAIVVITRITLLSGVQWGGPGASNGTEEEDTRLASTSSSRKAAAEATLVLPASLTYTLSCGPDRPPRGQSHNNKTASRHTDAAGGPQGVEHAVEGKPRGDADIAASCRCTGRFCHPATHNQGMLPETTIS